MNSFSLRGFAAALMLGISCSGCAHTDVVHASGTIAVVTTTTILVDFVRAVGGDRVSVRSIVPVGASVEEYEPAPQDIAAVHDARLLVENGAGLELWLHALIDNARADNLKEVVASDGLPLINQNPHLWMDPVNAQAYIAKICAGLIAVDPQHRSTYIANAARYDARLRALTAAVHRKIAAIPKQRRRMLVYHDAWRYYGERFGLRTAGAIELAPGRESAASQIAHLVDIARDSGISTVFSEPEDSSRLADALASSLPNGRVVPLYVDTVGNMPQVAGYIDLMSYDTDRIVAALK